MPPRPRNSVLIVDDMASIRALIKAVVSRAGFRKVAEASNGEAAWDLILSSLRLGSGYDLIVCDWDMPRLTGLEVLQRVRADDRTRHLPFIMLTANSNAGKVQAAVDGGVDDYIIKPFRPETLTSKIAKLLG